MGPAAEFFFTCEVAFSTRATRFVLLDSILSRRLFLAVNWMRSSAASAVAKDARTASKSRVALVNSSTYLSAACNSSVFFLRASVSSNSL